VIDQLLYMCKHNICAIFDEYYATLGKWSGHWCIFNREVIILYGLLGDFDIVFRLPCH
jgi:hypothetical protein